MIDTDHRHIDPDEVELLLPWYVSGRLAPAEVRQVEEAVAADPALRLQLDLIREETDEIARANEAITAPPARALDNLMQRIEAEPAQRHSGRLSLSGLVAMLETALDALSPRRLAYASMAAAAVILLQAGLVGGLLWQARQPGNTYTTASGGEQAGAFVLAQFQPGIDIARLSAFLARYDAEIVAGPKSGGLFKLRIGDKRLDEPARAQLMTRLAAETDVVAMILPSQ